MFDIEAIKKRREGATAGPWMPIHASVRMIPQVKEDKKGKYIETGPHICRCAGNGNSINNAVFIAASPEDIDALITEVERLEEEIADLESALEDCR